MVQAELCVAREDRQFLTKRLLRHKGYEDIEWEICCNEEEAVSTKNNNLEATFPMKKRHAHSKKSDTKNRRVTKEEVDGRMAAEPSTGQRKLQDLNQTASALRSVGARGGGTSGKLNAPLNLFNIQLYSIGQIVTVNANFHSEHWIYPVGYVATRVYAHPRDPQRKCVFTCKILNNAGIPQFQIIPDNDLDSVIFGDSPAVCHLSLLQSIQAALVDVVKLPIQVQGERFFGLANATVQSMLHAHGPLLEQCINFHGFLTPQEIVSGHHSEEKDHTLSFEALQSLVNMSAYHTMPEIKDEPPDELFELN